MTQQQPNLLQPNNNQYTQHLKLTEQELEELKQHSREATKILEQHYGTGRSANQK